MIVKLMNHFKNANFMTATTGMVSRSGYLEYVRLAARAAGYTTTNIKI